MRRRRRCGCGGLGLPNKADLAQERGGEALIPPPRYPLQRFAGVLAPNSSWRRAVLPTGVKSNPLATQSASMRISLVPEPPPALGREAPTDLGRDAYGGRRAPGQRAEQGVLSRAAVGHEMGVARSKGFWGRTSAERVGPGGGLRRSTQAEEAEKEPQMSGISSAGQIAA